LQRLSSSPKSKTAEIEVKKQDAKGKAAKASASDKQKPWPAAKAQIAVIEVRKPDGKGATVRASSITIGAGLNKGSPTPKSKFAETEARQQDGKGKMRFSEAPRDRDRRQPEAIFGADKEGRDRIQEAKRQRQAGVRQCGR
jgi:hypothetical protein